MGGNVELFQEERHVNCVFCFLNSTTEANPCPPPKRFLTILNYILLKTTKQFLQLFDNNFLNLKVQLLKKTSMSTRTDLFDLRKEPRKEKKHCICYRT